MIKNRIVQLSNIPSVKPFDIVKTSLTYMFCPVAFYIIFMPAFMCYRSSYFPDFIKYEIRNHPLRVASFSLMYAIGCPLL